MGRKTQLLGNTEPPLQQLSGGICDQQQTEGGCYSGEDISSRAVFIPVGPKGPQAPDTEDQARTRRSEHRDRWRLGAEIATAIIGAVGLGALVITLSQTRLATEVATQSVITAQRQLELSERPWVTAEVALTRSFSTSGKVGIEVAVKNVGRSVAIDVGIRADIVYDPLFSAIENGTITFPLPDPSEIDVRREVLCGKRFRGTERSIEYDQSPLVLFPEQGGTIQAMAQGYPGDAKERAVQWRFDNEVVQEPPDEPLAVDRFVSPVLIGCVTYSSAFTQERYATEFTRIVSSIHHPDGHVPVGVSVPAENIRLKPYRSNSEKYAQKYID